MTAFIIAAQDSYPGFAAIFACIGLGFLFLRRVDRGEVGPGYWALSFFLGALGFLCWSGLLPIASSLYYLLGEICHIAGFFSLVCGIYRFTGRAYRPWNLLVLTAWLALWLASLALLGTDLALGGVLLKSLRALIFIAAGALIISERSGASLAGWRLAGLSLVAWGLYTLFFAFVRVEKGLELLFGLLVGFQVLAAFGLVAMVVDRMRCRAEESERRVERLEGLLPICSYCKRIRDKKGSWQRLEAYIEDRSTVEFSHGICPDCMKKYRPDRD